MNNFTTFVGIDISKKTFDASIYVSGKTSAFLHQAFAQSASSYACFLWWLQD